MNCPFCGLLLVDSAGAGCACGAEIFVVESLHEIEVFLLAGKMVDAYRREDGRLVVAVYDPDEPLSVRTVARILGWSHRRVQRAAARGWFPGAYKTPGRYQPDGEWRIPRQSIRGVLGRGSLTVRPQR